jgi:hypothetical protein
MAVAALPSVILGLWAAAPVAHASLAFAVNSTGDLPDAAVGDHNCDTQPAVAGDQCTLRAVIQESNMESGQDGIFFDIPGTGVKTIAPRTDLPNITGAVEIDGYSQGVASPNTKPLAGGDNAVLLVELSGERDSTSNPNGLTFDAGAAGSSVKGLVINRFSGTGIVLNSGANATIQGNFIGTGPAGMAAHGMGFDGFFNNAQAQVGGTMPADRNVISGNGRDAVNGNGTYTVQGNFLGTASDGVSPLGNQGSGVRIFQSNSKVGGAGGGANIIAFNANDGITMFNTSMNNTISRNQIYSNGDLGIDLGDDGVTPNDLGDGDTGPNELQNFPGITTATRGAGGGLTIVGKLRSTPDQSFTLEFFKSPPGGDEGETFIGQTMVSTDGTGLATFTFHPPRSAALDDRVTATATNANHSTSEFSAPRKVVSP